MRIGVLGTGRMGVGLGRQFAAAGHDVFMGSRSPEKGTQASVAVGGRGGTYRQAVEYGAIVLLAVPWSGVDESLRLAGDLSAKILIDVTNPYTDATYTQMENLPGSCGAEEIAKKARGARVVKCWNHIYAQIVNSSPDFGGQPATVFLCGDDAAAKETVIGLASDAGYSPVDAGPLASARLLEPLANLMVTLAYRMEMGTNQALRLVRR